MLDRLAEHDDGAMQATRAERILREMGFKAKELQQTTADLSGEAFDAARASCVATRESMRCMR